MTLQNLLGISLDSIAPNRETIVPCPSYSRTHDHPSQTQLFPHAVRLARVCTAAFAATPRIDLRVVDRGDRDARQRAELPGRPRHAAVRARWHRARRVPRLSQ